MSHSFPESSCNIHVLQLKFKCKWDSGMQWTRCYFCKLSVLSFWRANSCPIKFKNWEFWEFECFILRHYFMTISKYLELFGWVDYRFQLLVMAKKKTITYSWESWEPGNIAWWPLSICDQYILKDSTKIILHWSPTEYSLPRTDTFWCQITIQTWYKISKCISCR